MLLANLPALSSMLGQLRTHPGLPLAAFTDLDEAISIVADLDLACRDSVGLFDQLRRAG